MAIAVRVVNAYKHYPGRRGTLVHALRGVSIDLEQGRTLGIVGESGCGKSTLARLLVGLEPPSSGVVEVLGRLVARTPAAQLARDIQLVFQDPFSSLNPRLTVASTLSEVLAVHELAKGRPRRQQRVDELLAMVALAPDFAGRFPHELSGGQAQRVAIARALAVEPRAIVLDEPTSALDVSVRAEVMNLLVRLQDELGLSYVFISHDLAMVRHISDTITVMYLGKVVEAGPYDAVLSQPLHPYTRALADAALAPDPDQSSEAGLAEAAAGAGTAPPPAVGCPYTPRCRLAEQVCAEKEPALLELMPKHSAACHVAARACLSGSVPE